MNRWLAVPAAFALLVLATVPALPQATVRPCITTGAITCPPVSASNPMPITGTVTAGGTQDTNIIQILGAAPSATNPIWVSPATASTPWVVTGSGTAGTAAAGVVTVQGIASMTPFLTSGTWIAPIAPATATATNSVLVGAQYNSTLPTWTNGQQGSAQLSARGMWLSSACSTTGACSQVATNSDALASQNGLFVINQGSVFNGSTYDRTRGDTTGTYTIEQASTVGGASYLNIAAGTATTVVKASAGKLYAIILNSAATATNTTVVYDHASGAGTVIGRPAVTTATVPTTLNFGPAGLAFANGLTIITAAANGGDMTIIYK